MVCYALPQLNYNLTFPCWYGGGGVRVRACVCVCVCVCVWGGGGGGFLFRDRKILMYCFYCFIKNNTLLKAAVELAAVCSLLREWGGAWDTQFFFFFLDNDAFKK